MMKAPEHDVVHIAIPTHDKALAKKFYSDILGGEIAREYGDRVTFKLFSHQLVCHLDPDYAPAKTGITNPMTNLYPRHFGVTFLKEKDLQEVYNRIKAVDWEHLSPIKTRFSHLPERHLTFFTADPTSNMVEFKWYEDAQFVY